MTDEMERRLRALRPPTEADEGWARSAQGAQAFGRIHDAVAGGTGGSRGRWAGTLDALRARRTRLGLAVVAVSVVTGLALTVPDGLGDRTPGEAGEAQGGPAQLTGAVPVAHTLSAADSCEALLTDLREHAVAHPDAYDRSLLAEGYGGVTDLMQTDAAMATPRTNASGSTAYSRTNNQEAGVDEPDLVKTDGERIVSVTGGVLRVTDVADRAVVGSLDLTAYAGSESATLLVDGDRALVSMSRSSVLGWGGRIIGEGPVAGTSSTFVLVDLAGDEPRVLSMLRPTGGLVDARLVDGRVRLVVRSAADVVLPQRRAVGKATADRDEQRRAVLRRAPLDAWLPSYTVTTGGDTTEDSVPCTSVVHPPAYTGADLLTVYTVDLDADAFGDLSPVTLTADGSTAYATPTSLYLTSGEGDTFLRGGRGADDRTEIHRFDIAGAGKPDYLGSGTVPGTVLDAYSLSEHDGALRVVTTTGTTRRTRATAVYALDADTLAEHGHVAGLGKGEEVYGVRYAGPYAYLVTFRRIDPLYVVDLSDPARPVASGELKITGYSDYLHVVGDGRLLGVGMEATRRGRVTGAQISLFDVADPARPTQLSRLLRPRSDSSDVADPHAFLYWAPTRTAFVPIRTWTGDGRTEILAVRVEGDTLRVVATLAHPDAARPGSYDAGIRRAVVVGDTVWTLSDGGLRVSAAADLAEEAWIAFD